jgi:damage-control phosphatase, subfamily III
LIIAISSTGDPKSFGYTTSRDRWPSILENVIKDVKETMQTSTPEKAKEGKEIIAAVEGLRSEVLNDAIVESFHSQIRLM